MKRIRYYSFAYVLLFSLLVFSLASKQTQAFADNVDTTPPVVTDIILSTTTVTAPGTVQVTVIASDDSSGISGGTIWFKNLDTNGQLASGMYVDGNNNLTVELSVSDHTNAGDYVVSCVEITDAAGNTAYYYGEGYEYFNTAQNKLPENCRAKTITVTNDTIGIEISESIFPDYNFRYYVSSNCDIDGDGFLSESEISEKTNIQCANYGIRSLTGIKVFSALQELDCSTNFMTELDLSGLSALNYLDCSSNQLTNIDLTGCGALGEFRCSDNQLTSLDLSNFHALYQFVCINNSLIDLNLSQCSALEFLSCPDNQLTYLNINGCVQLVRLFCFNNQLTSLDISSCPKLDVLKCQSNLLSSLDIRWCPALLDVYRAGNDLGPDWTQSVASYCYPDNYYFAPILTLDRNVTVYSDFLIDEVYFPDTTFLPSALSVIEQEAFSNSSFVDIFLSESIREIKSRAFANCTSLHTVVIINASITIEPDAFIGCSNLTIIAPTGGSVQTYAKENNIPFISIRAN